MPTARIDGHRIHYITAGDPANPPLLMIHGWLSYIGVWRQTIEAFSDSFYCVALDLLGFGDSDKPRAADYSIPAQAQRVVVLAEALGLEKFALIGHSRGGQIATYIAAVTAPERVTRLVSVAGVVMGILTPRVREGTYPMVFAAAYLPFMYAIIQPLLNQPWYANHIYRPWFYDMDNPPFDTWREDRERAIRPDQHWSIYQAGLAIRALNLTPHLPKIRVPALAIFGEFDGTVPVSDGEIFRQGIPGAQLVMIPQCGHFPMYEQTEAYLAALKLFLLT